MIVPVGVEFQQLILLERMGTEVTRTCDMMVRFVPMVHPGPGT